ncbi:phage tail protein [Mammaliicoccus sciuri]|uniref:phage tail spike protein n=1 Tax=Mammaliicoccus sciuri TaxID=1296 RepID=UPI0019D35D0E|nr:phage tail spike protein [Mammaliicoccus sciuri]MEB8072222.1 phage tail protein [Mammaliicoccus sciuri]QSN67021.1 phage tail protein [Mammaliicoccus sciuri]UIU21744.1 phage tail protein [Mammaliicoccus sciuri]UIU24644.1 phage tail protein [Mammaliicoccus sciuri]
MIHVLNFNSEIIDFISKDDLAVIRAEYTRSKEDKSEMLNITLLSERAEHFKERNRVIIQDKTNAYREFIINRIEEEGKYLEIECDASYVEDIGKAKPIPAGKFTKMTVNEALSETLRDSGWEEGLCEYGGIKSMSWTSVRTPHEMISQLTTTYKLEPDYEIEIEGNEVIRRKVNMLQPKPLFEGKEIVYGKDLISMKRTVDMSEVKTALYAEGPEKEDGSRISVAIVDKDAQEQFGLPERYLWGFYEPESDDQNMTLERLTTLTKTQLNKRKASALSYEIEAFDLEKEYPHEIIRFGDIVRIKNPDYTPSLYAESEVIGFTHELISEELTWNFGNIVEYKEDDLLKYFRSRLEDLEKKMNNDINNIETIITDRIDDEVERLQRKLHRGPTPPDNPEEGDFWFDTSNPNVAVLREFVNGEWKHASAHDVEQIGGLSREVIIYRQVLEATHSMSAEIANQMERTNVALSSEYLVDLDVKGKLQKALSDMLAKLQIVQNYMDSMTEETATIGRLMEWQSALVDLRNDFYYLIVALIEAEKAIQERLKYLQSQYTEEKFNEAMQNVADKFGFEYTEDGFLVGEGSLISGAIQALREDTEEQFKQVVKSVDYETDKKGIIERLNGADSAREQLDKLIKDRVTLTEYNKMKIGTRNLLLNSKERSDLFGSSTHRRIVYHLTEPLKVGQEYTLTFDMEVTSGDNFGKTTVLPYEPSNGSIDITIDNSTHNKLTFVANVPSTLLLIYSAVNSTPENDTTEIKVTDAMLVEGNKIGDYSQAPKEQEERLETMETSIEQNGKDISLKASEEEFNKTKQTLSKTLSEVLINTTTGVTLSYDDNGNVNDLNVGPGGVKINANVFEINDGDVIVKDGVTTIKEAYIDKLFSNKATIDYLNSVDITAKRIQAVDNKATVNIENGVITMNRTDGHKLDIGINGIAMTNPNGSTRFSMDRLLVTSAALGTSNSNVYLAAQQGYEVRAVDITQIPSDGAWDSYRYVPVRALAFVGNKLMTNGGTNLYLGTDAEVRVTARGGYNGEDTVYRNVRALGYKGNFLDSNYVTNGDHIYIRPERGSEVRFTVRDTTHSYVDIRGGTGWLASVSHRDSNARFYIGSDNGVRITGRSLYNGGDVIWRNLAANGLYANFLDVNPNTNATNLYLRGKNEIRITKNGTTDSYIPIRAASATWTSSEQYKYDIEDWNVEVLDHLVNRIKLYSYKLKAEKDNEIERVRHGVILERETPDEWKNGDGVDSYEMTAWSIKAIQELAMKVKKLEERVGI